MMSGSITEERAQEIIKEVVKNHGFVQEATLNLIGSFNQEARREVEEALLVKDKQIGSSVLTLAKNLYTSQARFVFELLQNADDNHYTRGQDPYILFRVYPDRVVVECNEDGFTEENITAICDIGKSSKTGSQAYIGEKGIGFKSVFIAAWKVHIQSGPFSFDFVQRKGDSGMGMINPIWQENRDRSLPLELTRLTLYLHNEGDPAELEKIRQDINQQFHDLQDTLLLFLRKLQKIEVYFHNDEGRQMEGKIYTLNKIENSDTAVIERMCTDAARNRRQLYHIVKHIARGLARNENRNLFADEKASKSFATSEIVLAFPVVEDSVTGEEVPVIEPQEVFAFLPVRRMGFNFLIHADFVTQANRQDIVMSSRRNQGLIEAIADAFIAGVLQLCQHHTLEYQWMRYLPLKNSFPWDGLWNDLISSIKTKLETVAVLRSLERNRRLTIMDLCDRVPMLNDQHGAPLFADLQKEVYLSDSYAPADIDILKKFGLESVTFEMIVLRVKQDLLLGPEHSRIKSPKTDNDWQTRAYQLLNLAWRRSWSHRIRTLKNFEIIPLQDGSWASSDSGAIYYPKYGDVEVPKSLGMRLVDPAATGNASRCAFFDNLGVHPIDVAMVSSIRELILQQSMMPSTNVNLESSIERMRFLFLTQHLCPEELDLSNKFIVYNHLNIAMYPNVADLYIPDDDPYGAEVFLRQKGREVNCVNSRYFEEIPSVTPDSNCTLHQWMHQHLGIRQHLRLVSSDRASLSVECLDTANTRAAEFISFLVHLWQFEGDLVLSTPSLLKALKRIPVLCMNGNKRKLKETFVPLQSLLNVHKRFLGENYFPFIQSSELSGQDEVPPLWSFLVRNLGVGKEDNVSFRLEVMRYLKDADTNGEIEDISSRVIDLYQSIDACLRISLKPEAQKRKIQDAFYEDDLVFIPPWNSMPASWEYPEKCLWEAPSSFISKIPLKEIYVSSFQSSNAELDRIAAFFRETLDIDDIDWSEVIAELEKMKKESSISGEVVRQLYGILYEKSPTDEDAKRKMRESFETGALIYFDHNGTPGWHRPSDCVWSDTTHIHGKIAVNAQYSDLKALFVESLQVPPLDLEMVFDQLLKATTLSLTSSEIKELLKTLNSFLRSEPSPPSPEPLLYRRIFPVREPGSVDVTLCNSKTQFTVVDRVGPSSQFIEVVRVLDFTQQEIYQLKPLLVWLGLESRYLSRCVRETSQLGDGVHSPISQPHRDLKKKAKALLRISAAFNSPRYLTDPEGFYHLLCTAVTLESGVISSSLSLEQDGVVHEIEVGQSELHIVDSTPLMIYVPNDIESQECCFKFDLPHRFAEWMMTDPTTGKQGKIEDGTVNVINSILNCTTSTTGRILEKEGIPEVPGIAEALIPIVVIDEEAGSSMAVNADIGNQSERSSRTPSRAHERERLSSPESTSSAPATPMSPLGMESAPDYPTPLTDPENYDSDDDSSTPDEDHSIPPPQFNIPERESLAAYRRLLERVVTLARQTTLPNNFDDISTMFQGLSVGEDPFEGAYFASTSNNWEHRRKIGAAGELFVFKILSGIAGLGFDLQNWRSHIRGYAQVLPEYAALRAWPGPETSDIVYEDTDGVFTCLMIALGYLNGEHWAGKTPTYYIEVKCTTGYCAKPCIVSQNQVDLMERTTNGPQGNQNQSTVYALFRVFGLGSTSMGLKIYIDPEEQRRLGKLTFTSEKYSVAPVRW